MRKLALLAYVAVCLLMWNMMPNPYPGGGLFTRLAVLMILLFVATFVHELGHAAAVRWNGGQIKVFMVTPFRLQMKPRRLRLATAGGKGDFGGYVSYTLDRIDARRGHGIIAAAGPAANIVLAAVATFVVLALREPHAASAIVSVVEGAPPIGLPSTSPGLPSDELIQAWVTRRRHIALAESLVVISAGMALLNLIPFKGSDGDHILYALSSRYRRTRR